MRVHPMKRFSSRCFGRQQRFVLFLECRKVLIIFGANIGLVLRDIAPALDLSELDHREGHAVMLDDLVANRMRGAVGMGLIGVKGKTARQQTMHTILTG
jgi:hypothetical protein